MLRTTSIRDAWIRSLRQRKKYSGTTRCGGSCAKRVSGGRPSSAGPTRPGQRLLPTALPCSKPMALQAISFKGCDSLSCNETLPGQRVAVRPERLEKPPGKTSRGFKLLSSWGLPRSPHGLLCRACTGSCCEACVAGSCGGEATSYGVTLGIIVVVEVSPYQPFPDDSDVAKSRRTREVRIWVE